MRIACIAWGSLLWKAGPLRLTSAWMPGGPLLPIEFARTGDMGELAVVICAGAAPMPTRWACIDAADMPAAREQLRQREQASPDHPEWIGGMPSSGGDSPFAATIDDWLRHRGFDGAVWTALPPKIAGTEGRVPSSDEAVAYLAGLSGRQRAHAKDYVERVPADIRTPYRVQIERRLGWLPRESAEPAVVQTPV